MIAAAKRKCTFSDFFCLSFFLIRTVRIYEFIFTRVHVYLELCKLELCKLELLEICRSIFVSYVLFSF